MRLGTDLGSNFSNSPDSDRWPIWAWGGERKSLRTKGLIAFIALIVYLALVGALMVYQRDKLRGMVEQQEQLSRIEAALARVNIAISYSVLHQNDPDALKSHPPLGSIASDVKTIQAGLWGLKDRYPEMATLIAGLDQEIGWIRAAGADRSLIDTHGELHDVAHDLEKITRAVRADYRSLSEHFRTSYDWITLTSLILALTGAVVFGSIVASFFSRLVWDIRKLQARAKQVASGYRGEPIEVTRDDELASLMEAVNRMQAELREREKQLEISRQRRFHQEKMEAIGSLASAVAHEINNPLSAIMGVAERMSHVKQSSACPISEMDHCRPELILEHTKRISAITHQLAELSAPHSPEPALLDLNGLVQNTINFVTYDKRFRGIDLVLGLDRDLPAVRAVADHLTQVLMNLLINGADALEDVRDRKPTIRVATCARDSEILLTVSDNGHGMDHAVLSRVFEESFTTKPPGKGRGLGLFLCKALIEENGGRIELESRPDLGTTARVRLPLLNRTGA